MSWWVNLFLGLSHSLNLFHPVYLLLSCKEVHRELILSFILTGILFLGSLSLFELALAPILTLFPDTGRLFSFLYHLLWVFPLYIVCFILNSFWYADLARAAHSRISKHIKVPRASLSRRIAYELHRALMIGFYLAEVALLSYMWAPLALALLTWLYSFYSFEYRWELEGCSLAMKRAMLEHNWAYYCGFGVPFTVLTHLFPGMLQSGVWALLFPLSIASAFTAKPPPALPTSVPILAAPHYLCGKVEVLLLGRYSN